ncbi:MAG TPA: aminotransferase class V-fold PLP-dependent enzyme [Xanthomonadales bacterium]|nr:aminotransferase class V-fold PLP-dependent enzyme [Xanthomonadales bacterium]
MNVARRDFLKVVGGASLAGSLGAYALNASAQALAVPGFGFADDSVPMNAANLCPMPRVVTDAHNRYARQLDQSLSTASRKAVEAYKEEARSRVAGMLRVSADEIAIVRNASEANGTIVQGLPLGEGDEVVLWDQNHPSNLVAWDVQAARSGAMVRRFAVPTETGSIDEVVDLFVNVVGGNTRVVSFTHISNVTGFKLPVAEICAAIRRKKDDVFIHVDGAQTWGAVDINLGAIEADSFSGSAHKWFMGPREVGILYVRERHINSIWPNIISVPWGLTPADAPVGARKFDAMSQRDDAAIASLNDAALYHEAVTPAGIEAQSKAVADRLRDGLRDLGVGFVSSNLPAFTSSVVIIAAPQEHADNLVSQVFEDVGVQCAATGGFRMSPHVYNNADHVDRVIAALKKNRALLG